jgi:hypothetical protein
MPVRKYDFSLSLHFIQLCGERNEKSILSTWHGIRKTSLQGKSYFYIKQF